MPPQQDLRSCTPWDVLLASTVGSSVGRLILRPAFSWSGTTFSSLMPLRYQGGVWWVRARLSTVIDTPGLSLATVADQIASGGIDFDIEQAAGTGDFLPLARLTLRHVNPTCDDIAFDPTLHSDPEVELAPGWLGDVRRAAYRRSREGRDANNGQAVGSSLLSSTSGVCSRVAMPPSPPSSVGPGRPPLGSSLSSSS